MAGRTDDGQKMTLIVGGRGVNVLVSDLAMVEEFGGGEGER